MFHVGQKVVCVDSKSSGLAGLDFGLPVEGNIYTISAVGLINRLDPHLLPCVLVAELPRDERSPLWAHRFRPLQERKTDTGFAILEEIRRKASVPEFETASWWT